MGIIIKNIMKIYKINVGKKIESRNIANGQ